MREEKIHCGGHWFNYLAVIFFQYLYLLHVYSIFSLFKLKVSHSTCVVVAALPRAEAGAKALAAHPHSHYWRARWNVFEMVLAAGSAVTVFTVQGTWREQAGRPFRFFRVFRVIRFVPSLQMLCDQMLLAIPSMLSIIGLMMTWVFVYAGIGTQVFPYVKYGRSLNKDANFETFPNSFLVLFQCLTVRPPAAPQAPLCHNFFIPLLYTCKSSTILDT